MKDNHGIEIEPGDSVIVQSWGYGARAADVGLKSPVLSVKRTRVVILDADERERSVGFQNVAVANREGKVGFEYSRLERRGIWSFQKWGRTGNGYWAQSKSGEPRG